jgi:hypothetical protein
MGVIASVLGSRSLFFILAFRAIAPISARPPPVRCTSIRPLKDTYDHTLTPILGPHHRYPSSTAPALAGPACEA